ncbi:MAG: hypothetical protein ABJ273_06830, partial [Marinobacter alexandrii]
LMASAMEGYLYRVGLLGYPLRALMMVAGGMLIYPDLVTDLIGFGLLGLTYLWHWRFRQPVAAGVR